LQKRSVFFFILLFIFILTLVGCGGEAQEETSQGTAVNKGETKIEIPPGFFSVTRERRGNYGHYAVGLAGTEVIDSYNFLCGSFYIIKLSAGVDDTIHFSPQCIDDRAGTYDGRIDIFKYAPHLPQGFVYKTPPQDLKVPLAAAEHIVKYSIYNEANTEEKEFTPVKYTIDKTTNSQFFVPLGTEIEVDIPESLTFTPLEVIQPDITIRVTNKTYSDQRAALGLCVQTKDGELHEGTRIEEKIPGDSYQDIVLQTEIPFAEIQALLVLTNHPDAIILAPQ